MNTRAKRYKIYGNTKTLLIQFIRRKKNEELLKFIIRQSSNEDSIVLDCFSGSGTTLKAANGLGRKFIGIDNSDLVIEASKKKLEDGNYNFIDIDDDGEIKILSDIQLRMDIY